MKIVRPPRLTNGPVTATYRTAYDQNLRGGAMILRGSVAHVMLRVIAQPETFHHTIGISN
jgi:hypothetical protein